MKTQIDLNLCSKEPIHLPGSIQPHGILLELKEPELFILQKSANAQSLLGMNLNSGLAELLPPQTLQRIHGCIATKTIKRINPILIETPHAVCKRWAGILHRNEQGRLIFELEPMGLYDSALSEFYVSAKNSIEDLQQIHGIEDLKDFITAEVKRLTGFDRVMLYVFDKNWNGEVVAESLEPEVESFLHFHFPHTDIPEQARKLYAQNLLRFIADVNSTPSAMVAQSKAGSLEPIDLTFAALRSVSPTHIEYLKNMGVGASMSISLMREGKLWGLIACHHRVARQVSYETRTVCEFLARIFSYELANLEEREEFEHRKRLKEIRVSISHRLSFSNFSSALLDGATTAIDLLAADGAAILLGGKIHIVGVTPTEVQIVELAAWLKQRGTISTFSTSNLSEAFGAAAKYREQVSGLLAIALSKNGDDILFAFRRELMQIVQWSGNPNVSEITLSDDGKLHPRKSFASWRETMRGQCLPWRSVEIEAAAELKETIMFEQLIDLNNSLEEKIQDLNAFAHIASHDLKEPLRTVTSFVALIELKAGKSASEELKKYIGFAIGGTKRMANLIDSLARFSQSSVAPLSFSPVDLNLKVAQVVEDLNAKIGECGGTVSYEHLPTVLADPTLLSQVFQNLISNALTYRGSEPPIVRISATKGKDEWILEVSDNGIGIPNASRERIFEVFFRLHGSGQYPGSGLGLAICKRIINRHHGRIWYEPAPVQGSCFKFNLSRR